MLSAAFFFSVFASVIWFFYALGNLGGDGANAFAVTTAVVVLPVFILWAIFGYVYQYLSASVLNKNMYSLFKQMKKNQEYSDVIAKVMLEARQNLQDNIILSKFDVFVADMNELLSEIIARGGLASSEQIDHLWVKVKNGGKWAFGKVIIELSQTQPNLPDRLLQKALRDVVLGGTILEFCSRYQTLIGSLEKHDRERLFLNVLETGVMGKVFSLLASPADSIRQNRDLTLARAQMTEPEPQPEPVVAAKPQSYQISTPTSEPENRLSENARRLFINTFTRRKKSEPEPETSPSSATEADPLSLAFAKSFGAPQSAEAEPHFETPAPAEPEPTVAVENKFTFEPAAVTEPEPVAMPEIIINHHTEAEETAAPSLDAVSALQSEPEPAAPTVSAVTPELEQGFFSSGEKLNAIRQEWENAKQRDISVSKEPTFAPEEGMPEPKVGNDDDYSYPFGGWTNADNYNK